MHTNKEQPQNQTPNQASQPQKGHTDTDREEEDRNKEDIPQVPEAPDDDIIEHTSWERPQTEEDKDRVL